MTSSVFPDVNLLVALFAERHVHHNSSRRWFSEAGSPDLIVCRISQLGFLRVLTTRAVMGDEVLTNNAAIELCTALERDQIIRCTAEPRELELSFYKLSRLNNPSPNRWADAYLSAFAFHAGLQLVTFDKALASYTPGSILLPDQ